MLEDETTSRRKKSGSQINSRSESEVAKTRISQCSPYVTISAQELLAAIGKMKCDIEKRDVRREK